MPSRGPDLTVPSVEGFRSRYGGMALLESELLGPARVGPVPSGAVRAAAGAAAAERVPAVARTRGRWRCMRCGGTSIRLLPCGRCGRQACPFCEECAVLGAARGCDLLYRFPPGAQAPLPAELLGETNPPGVPPASDRAPRVPWPRLPFPLTPAQRRVARLLTRWVTDPAGPASMLLWAACGAGKTELLLAAAAAALGAGKRVLVATPRREVVLELEPRIRRSLAPLPVAVWYGGVHPAQARFRDGAPVVVATTHQSLRFYRAFHLVAVDELDAFPFRDHAVLRRAVERAGAPGARRLWVSATPPAWLRREARRRGRGGTGVVYLPARPHGHPLPEPRLLWDPRLVGWRAPGMWPRRLRAWMEASRERAARLLVFVPTVAHAQALPPLLARLLREPVGSLWAHHPQREREVDRFRAGGVRVLVSTSVLERGVTLPAVDVLVLFPEHPVFDAAALVQMAGRAGRSPEDPHGRVLFAGVRPSRPALAAAAAIRTMNRRASREGLLVGSRGDGGSP